MANPRANIYPIQLQGAELNLNKYDSEIKQYSGFNKNNAPFVGGCLSNIFTKNENHSDEGKNVYIDKNGNFYKYDGVGLSKNGEYLFTVPEGTKNYNVEEVKVPEDIVYFNSPDCYVTCKKTDTGYTLENHYPGESEEIVTSINVEDVMNFSSVNPYQIFFAYRRVSDGVYIFVKVYSQIENTENINVQSFCYFFSNIVTVLKDTNESNFILNKNYEIISNCVPGIILGEDGYIGLFQNESSTKQEDTFTISDENVHIFDTETKIKSTEVGSFANSDTSYIFGERSLPYFCNYKMINNVAYVLPTVKIKTFVLDLTYLKPYGKLTLRNRQLFFDNSESNLIPFNFALRLGTQKFYFNYKNYILKNYGAQYTIFLKQISPDKTMIVGICDFNTQAVTVENSEIMFYTGGLIGGCVLTNNNEVTGITLPGGNILVANWGSVDADSIFVSQGDSEYYTILYKDVTNNKWYRVYETEEKLLFVKNNQVVINANSIPNAYDVDDEEIRVFAIGWNNRYPLCVKTDYGTEELKNNYYVASAFNEQFLDKNASIILNPIPVLNIAFDNNDTIKKLLYINRQGWFNNIYINYYIGLLTENQVKYCYSNDISKPVTKENVIVFFDLIVSQTETDFEGLPFPIDTNGNIQYSPSLFSEFFNAMGNDVFVKENSNVYQLMKSNNVSVMSFYLGTLTENLQTVFILQGQYYGIINDNIYSFVYANGIVQSSLCVVNVQGLQFCGNTPYQAIFYSETNRCLYSFTGANILQQMQFVDKISEVYGYKYNPATQSIFLLTDIGVIVSSLFGIYQIDFANPREIFLLNNGVVVSDNQGNYKWMKYYNEDDDEEYEKQNIVIETCFYGADNQTVTINDCLYMRLFCEEKTDGVVKVQATTISNEGKTTQKTQFNIKSSDWDKEENCIYLRYQPKQQRGLGISFKIDSPFKIASLSVGSTPDAILIDKVSKSAINGNSANSSIIEW